MDNYFQRFKKFTLKEKLKYILIAIFLVLFPIIIEMVVFKNYNLEITLASCLRVLYIYGLYVIYILYKILSSHIEKIKKCTDFLMKYRYIIAWIAFVIMVVLKLNISNIDAWKYYIENGEETSTNILGKGRFIRSDEWKVQTSFFFSQALSDEYYPLFNDNVSDGQNMLMVYPAPVADITIIGKPQNLGFLLFGKDYGYSWYWSFKVIGLILISIEICKILTKNNSFLSLIGGICLAYSPAIQWWASSNGDIYMHGFAIIVLFHYFVNNAHWNIKKKLLIALGMLSSIAGFVFCFYPAVQVPFAYVMLVFLLVDFVKNYKNLKLKDYIIMAVTILIALCIVGYYVYVSFDAISLIMNTVYPGSRNLTGGTADISVMIKYFFNIFSPYGSGLGNVETNESEVASFIYPFVALVICMIFGVKDIKEKIKKQENLLFFGLCIVYIFLFCWMFLGFGNIFSKITLLYMCQPERVALILGLVGFMLCIMVLNRKEVTLQKLQALGITLLVLILSTILINLAGYGEYFTLNKKIVLYPVIAVLTYTLLTVNTKAYMYTLFLVTAISGMTINPLNIGTDAIFGTDTSQEIRSILESDEESSIWVGNSSLDAQYLVANGAKVLNGVNYYPNFDMLYKLDPDKVYEEVYNRYAHIALELTDSDKTKFVLDAPDAYTIYLSQADFKNLGIDYYYSSEALDENIVTMYNLLLEFYDEEEGKYIYFVVE